MIHSMTMSGIRTRMTGSAFDLNKTSQRFVIFEKRIVKFVQYSVRLTSPRSELVFLSLKDLGREGPISYATDETVVTT